MNRRLVHLSCTRCGVYFGDDTDALRAHPPGCSPRWWYWAPRAYPWLFMTVTCALGIAIGLVLR